MITNRYLSICAFWPLLTVCITNDGSYSLHPPLCKTGVLLPWNHWWKGNPKLLYFASVCLRSFLTSLFISMSIMYSPTELVLAAVQTIIALLGFITNGFVVVVNLWDWKFNSSLSTSDYFMCSVALSNLSLQLWSGFSWFCDLFGYYGAFCQSTFSLKMISTLCSLRVAGLLCSFYCARIVVSKNWIFKTFQNELRKSFRKVIFHAIISTVMLGLPLLVIKKEQLAPKSGYLSLNIGSISFVNNTFVDNSYVIYRIFLLSFGYTYPLLLSLVSAAFIIVSLKKHIRKMQDSMKKKDGVFIDAHQRAAITVLSLLIFIIMYFVTSIITLISIFPTRDLRLILCELISTLYAPALGIVLIRGNSKLRKVASRIQMKVVGMLGLAALMKENISLHTISN